MILLQIYQQCQTVRTDVEVRLPVRYLFLGNVNHTWCSQMFQREMQFLLVGGGVGIENKAIKKQKDFGKVIFWF